MKPLSQTGIGRYRIPKNPRQRSIDPNTGMPVRRKALDAINERLAGRGVTLHPTKGYRPISAKRSAAAMLTAEIRAGMFPFNTAKMRSRLVLDAEFGGL